MTRTEALDRLEGTWTYEVRDGRVRVRDVTLLLAIQALRREEDHEADRPRRAAPIGTALRG